MSINKVISTFFFSLILMISSSFAQEEKGYEYPMFNLTGNFNIGVPTGKFATKMNGVGIGGSGTLLFRMSKELPLYGGIEMGGMVFDRESINYSDFVDGELLDLRQSTGSKVFNGQGIIQYKPDFPYFIIPYLNGFIGFNNFYTRTKVEIENAPEESSLSNEVDLGEWALTYGVGVGAIIPIVGDILFVDVKASYALGSAVDYYSRIPNVNGPFADSLNAFDLKNSTTDMLVLQIGVTFTPYRSDFEEDLEEYIE